MRIKDKHFFCRWTSYILRVFGLVVLAYSAFLLFPYRLLAISATLFLGSIAFKRPSKEEKTG